METLRTMSQILGSRLLKCLHHLPFNHPSFQHIWIYYLLGPSHNWLWGHKDERLWSRGKKQIQVNTYAKWKPLESRCVWSQWDQGHPTSFSDLFPPQTVTKSSSPNKPQSSDGFLPREANIWFIHFLEGRNVSASDVMLIHPATHTHTHTHTHTQMGHQHSLERNTCRHTNPEDWPPSLPPWVQVGSFQKCTHVKKTERRERRKHNEGYFHQPIRHREGIFFSIYCCVLNAQPPPFVSALEPAIVRVQSLFASTTFIETTKTPGPLTPSWLCCECQEHGTAFSGRGDTHRHPKRNSNSSPGCTAG